MKEIWKQIKNYEGYYEVSNLGKVRSMLRLRKGHKGLAIVKSQEKKLRYTEKGYMRTQLYKHNRGKIVKIHRLVATAFLPNPNGLPEVDHINRKRSDNNVKNLRWSTVKANRQKL